VATERIANPGKDLISVMLQSDAMSQMSAARIHRQSDPADRGRQ
jgi:hypothetical protein